MMSTALATQTSAPVPWLARLVRRLARVLNPLAMTFAGRRWMPIVGILRHRGRRSGRLYSTPLGMRLLGDDLYLPNTFGGHSEWLRNLQAEGRAEVTYLGRTEFFETPETVGIETAAPAFPAYERLQFGLLGINRFVRLRRSRPRLAAEPGPRPEGGRGTALAVIALAQLMVVLDVAVVNVALPSIQKGLHFAATDLEWVVNAYAIAFGGLLLLGGRAGDRFGRRRMFILGTLLFTGGSLAGGLANSAAFLVAARAAQGVGGAIVAPTALALLAGVFADGPARNRALGVYSAVSAGGGALGLLLGGVIVNYLSWRWILFINVPVGIVLALAAPRVLPRAAGRPGRLDLPGALTVTGGAALLVYGLARAAVHGFGDGQAELSLLSSVVLLTAFVLIEAFSAQPLLPLRILADRNRAGTYVISLATGGALSGVLFLLTLYLQDILGFTPLQAGLAFLPTGLGVMAGAGLTSRLLGRLGPRLPMAAGSLLAATGLFWLTRIGVHSQYPTAVFGPLVTLAVGMGAVFVSSSYLSIAGVSRAESGLASALLNVGRQLGGSLGIAVMGTVATQVAQRQLAGVRFSPAAAAAASASGFGEAFGVAGFLVLAGFVAVMVMVRGRRPDRDSAKAVEQLAA